MIRFPAALLLAAVLLDACVPAPCAYNPSATCYAPAAAPGYAYPPGGYPSAAPGYPPPNPGQSYIGPDGLTYSNGYPVTEYDGAEVPYVFLPDLGGWGYYDNGHRWHGAPPDIRQRLDHDHPGGRGFPPPDRFRPSSDGYRPTQGYRPGEPAFRPGVEPGRPGFAPGGPGFQPGFQPGFRPGPGPQPGPGAERSQPPGRGPVPVNAQRPPPPRQEAPTREAPAREERGRRTCPANQPNC